RLVAGHPVPPSRAEVDPPGKCGRVESAVAGRRPKVHHVLPRRRDAIAHDVWKDCSQPRTAGEDERVTVDRAAIIDGDAREPARFEAAGTDVRAKVDASFTDHGLPYELARRPRP